MRFLAVTKAQADCKPTHPGAPVQDDDVFVCRLNHFTLLEEVSKHCLICWHQSAQRHSCQHLQTASDAAQNTIIATPPFCPSERRLLQQLNVMQQDMTLVNVPLHAQLSKSMRLCRHLCMWMMLLCSFCIALHVVWIASFHDIVLLHLLSLLASTFPQAWRDFVEHLQRRSAIRVWLNGLLHHLCTCLLPTTCLNAGSACACATLRCQ